MYHLDQIDPNRAVKATLYGENLLFSNVRNAPFHVYGLLPGSEEDPFRRIPESVAKACSEGVYALHRNTAGGRVRFLTDSSRIAVRVKMPGKCLMSDQALLGSSGLDLYVTENGVSRYIRSFMPPIDMEHGYDSMVWLPDRTLRDITINFPLYDCVDQLLIGLEPDAKLLPAPGYRNEKPILFYGSSITQGGNASRPGNSYQGFLSRNLNCDYRNLGWSGSAKGHTAMAEYIASQPMELFFMDYDHNADTPEDLAVTHEPFFRIIREKNPTLPVIFATKTDPAISPDGEAEQERRRQIIRTTYENARAKGDQNVLFLDGSQVFSRFSPMGITPDSCTIDGCHPNDLGFWCMAQVYGEAIASILHWD